jgi:hypothetical protein
MKISDLLKIREHMVADISRQWGQTDFMTEIVENYGQMAMIVPNRAMVQNFKASFPHGTFISVDQAFSKLVGTDYGLFLDNSFQLSLLNECIDAKLKLKEQEKHHQKGAKRLSNVIETLQITLNQLLDDEKLDEN